MKGAETTKRILSVLCILLSLISTSCSQHTEEPVKIDQDILFIYQYVNFSDGYINKGFYITKDGSKIPYSITNGTIIDYSMFDSEVEYCDPNHLYEYLLQQELPENQESCLTEEECIESYQNLYKIAPDVKIKETSNGYDGGSCTLYGVKLSEDGTPTLILIYANGDDIIENTDEHAKKIKEMFEERGGLK